MTGARFYTTFKTIQTDTVGTCAFGDVGAEIPGLKYGAGFLLWIEESALHTLEGYSYGEELWPEDIDYFKLIYFYDQRDFGKLKLL